MARTKYTQSGSSRNRENLLRLSPENAAEYGAREFSLLAQLDPVKSIFDEGDLAVVRNAGPLLAPVTRAQIENGTANISARLFSHNERQSTWMSFGVEGTRFG